MTAPVATIGLDEQAAAALADLTAQLRELAGDSAFAAGRDYLRKGLVRHGTFDGAAVYATVAGSTDYTIRVTLVPETKPRCSCPAFRRNPYCKHVVAVCLGFADRPGDFRRIEPVAVPEPAPKAARKPKGERNGEAKATKESSASRRAEEQKAALRASGLDTLDKLLVDLAEGGLVALSAERVAIVESVAATVRALKLRRLGNGLMALRLAIANRQGAVAKELAPDRFAALLLDLERTRQAVAAHLDGRAALDPALAEELLGKTWREADLQRTGGLDLLPIVHESTGDSEFRVETDYFVDLPTGALYTEKEITPAALRPRPTPSHRHRLLVDEAAVYPGAAPTRLKLLRVRRAATDRADIERVLAQAAVDVAAVRRQLTERLTHPFAPPEIAVLIRPSALVAKSRAVGLVDAAGGFLPVEWSATWRNEVPPLLPEPGEFALFGTLALGDDPARPLSLRPLAVVGHLRWDEGPVYRAAGAKR